MSHCFAGVPSTGCYLQGFEDARRGLEDAVDAVGHVEAVRPVVVGHLPVVLPDGDEEPRQGLVVEPVQSEEVHEHVERLPHLLHVVHVQRVEGEPVQREWRGGWWVSAQGHIAH